MNKLPEIPSEYIEPYLVQFMGSMIGFIASARTEEEKQKNGCGWTVADIKQWMKGVEVFVSHSCGIHARYAMMNELQKFIRMPDEELYNLCHRISMETVSE